MAIQILVPELGESVVQATVGRWLKKEGDHVNAGETVVELETDKVDLEVGASSSGILSHIEKNEGNDVHVGDVLGIIEVVSEKQSTGPVLPPSTKQPAAATEVAEPTDGGNGDRVTPVAARFAREKGIDVVGIPGTGPGGRVTKQDVQSFVDRQQPSATSGGEPSARHAQVTPQAPTSPARPQGDREERVRMSRRRRTIAERLLQVTQTTAMLTTFNEVDMSKVMELRRKHRESFKERHGVNLGLSSFFVRAVIGALKALPQINSEIQGDELVFKHHYDIGIAVGATEGLVVPVLHDADRLSFGEIEKKVKDLADKAENGQLSIKDLAGGTFTITNGGVFGSLMSTPILNPPQVAILGLHKIEDRPIAYEGQVVVRPMMYVALSYDHRAVDGREAVQFLVRVKQLIEDPERLLLEG